MNNLVSGLMFIPIPIGGIAACLFYIFHIHPKYQAAMRVHHPNLPPPEHHIEPGAYGAILLPISFFWFAWTSYPNISYWAPMMAGFPLGMGIVLLYLGLFSYHRRLFHVHCVGFGSGRHGPVDFRSGIPVVCEPDVRETQPSLGGYSAWGGFPPNGSHPVCFV